MSQTRKAERLSVGLWADLNILRHDKPGKTAIVWIETPVNPTWGVIDIADAAGAARGSGAILGVDCTVSTHITTRALDLGADIVFLILDIERGLESI